jgi:hypothetical protein
MSDFDLLPLFSSSPEQSPEEYLKTSAHLSYPEKFIKTHTMLEKPIDIYMRFVPQLQAEAGSYLKSIPTLQREVSLYLRFALAFPGPAQRYVKTASSLQARRDEYIRAQVRFEINAQYIKLRVALAKQPIIGELGNTPPEGKVGLLSRHYVSVVSVKKDLS